jgi:hypothetical protein
MKHLRNTYQPTLRETLNQEAENHRGQYCKNNPRSGCFLKSYNLGVIQAHDPQLLRQRLHKPLGHAAMAE